MNHLTTFEVLPEGEGLPELIIREIDPHVTTVYPFYTLVPFVCLIAFLNLLFLSIDFSL